MKILGEHIKYTLYLIPIMRRFPAPHQKIAHPNCSALFSFFYTLLWKYFWLVPNGLPQFVFFTKVWYSGVGIPNTQTPTDRHLSGFQFFHSLICGKFVAYIPEVELLRTKQNQKNKCICNFNVIPFLSKNLWQFSLPLAI